MRQYLLNAIVTVCFLFADHCVKAADFQRASNQNGGLELITVVGDLYAGDEQTFINIALSSSNAVVVFQSRGGNLLAGIEIGKAIHLKGFSTLVPGDVQCASACALAWLGGLTRFMSNAARVGFHAVYTEEGGRPNISSAGNALVGAYLNQLGLPASAVVYITDTSPDKIQWLTFSDAQRYGIDVKAFDTTATTGQQPRSFVSTIPATPTPDYYAAVAICFSKSLLARAHASPCSGEQEGVCHRRRRTTKPGRPAKAISCVRPTAWK